MHAVHDTNQHLSIQFQVAYWTDYFICGVERDMINGERKPTPFPLVSTPGMRLS